MKNPGQVPAPVGPTKWELFLATEKIEEDRIRNNNSKVLKFIHENLDKFYIPTRVLKMYGMDYEG